MPLPTAIYSAAQVRELDDFAIETQGVSGYTLMKRAGEASLRVLRSRWPTAHRIAIVCGGGNNGGDGYVLARFAQAAGLTATVLAVTPVEALRGDAQRAAEDFLASTGNVQPFTAEALRQGEVIVDALIGIGGGHGALRDDAFAVIEAMNAAARPVFALDIPSGLCPDRGVPRGAAVRADSTLTFVGLKCGLFIGDGPEYAGQLQFDDLGISPPSGGAFAPRLTRASQNAIARALPRRARTTHKGNFGHVLVIGGGAGMPGAARLSGEAALRVGAGLVTAAVAPASTTAIAAGAPELIVHGVAAATDLDDLVERCDVIAIGPGLGRTDWSRAMLSAALSAGRPTIVDADALNLIAAEPRRAEHWVLTPHPGEAARLLDTTVAEVQADRLGALERLCKAYGGIVVLKGAGTLTGKHGGTPQICERGNPGMASAGMGDVLTGVIAGLLAQTGDSLIAAQVGVLVHALAGDAAARGGERGLLARDVIAELRPWVNR
jgi:NAD(P)H-hydrate epimerase